MLFSLMSWWYLIEYSHNGATNTTLPFPLGIVSSSCLDHSAHCNLEWNGWNNESFEAERNSKVGDFQFQQFPLLKANNFSVNDNDAKPAMVVLGQFERCSNEGLRTNNGRQPMRQGSNTRDTALVHLVPEFISPCI